MIPLAYVSSSQEKIWQHQSKKTFHLLLSCCLLFVAIILAFCGKNHWQLEHIKKDIVQSKYKSPGSEISLV